MRWSIDAATVPSHLGAMSGAASFLLHGTCVALGPHGVLLRGPSGAGKSDLALRLIERGARLVADDQVVLKRDRDTLLASAPAAIRGRIEVRGLGIVAMTAVDEIPLALVVDLVAPEALERMPTPAEAMVGDMRLSQIAVTPFEPSAAFKVALALGAATGAVEVIR
ncbi:HPr kinase/phosphatase C-terminal domain-containing protein [Zavarzinia compransoris]|uniref:HPr kinase/phosphorylase n=1 Tax=Zavarzinia marina TaxID=2911065 RepID=UPI001F29B965|nr:HPr kinase/phosphatase C-terminal domain-containing protein [Zavarzinia marina]MCF4166189.1 HPr kinase/phosphatase C-terminal domain-containing protein [Zavarzinia marina]